MLRRTGIFGIEAISEFRAKLTPRHNSLFDNRLWESQFERQAAKSVASI